MRQNYDNIDIEVLKRIVLQSDSLVEVTKKLGFGLHLNNSKKHIERLIKRNNISIEHFSTVKRVRDFTVRYDKNKLIELVNKSTTLKEILLELDILPIESNYKTLKKYLKKYNINYSSLNFIRNKDQINSKYSEENLKNIISNSLTFREIFNKLGLDTHGNNYKTLHKYINKYNIDVSHFNVNAIQAKKLLAFNFNKIPIEIILVENSKYTSTNHLKNRLYDEGLKERICEKCGQGEIWHGEHMSLILDHIDGVPNNNKIENLRIVCPNCNATLPTFAGKNVRKKSIL
jgi:ribosomal protein S27AE